MKGYFIASALLGAVNAFQLDIFLDTKPDELTTRFWEIATPTNENYLSFLSLDELADLIGADNSVIEDVSAWLVDNGGYDLSVNSLRDVVSAQFNEHTLQLSDAGLPIESSHPPLVDFIVRRENTPPTATTTTTTTPPLSSAPYTIDNIKGAFA